MYGVNGSFLCPKSILVMFSVNLFIRVSLTGLNKDWVKVILGIHKANSQNLFIRFFPKFYLMTEIQKEVRLTVFSFLGQL